MNTDASAEAFLGFKPNPLRYEYYEPSPYEAHALISGLIPSRARILDVGCGTGLLAAFLDPAKEITYEGLEPMLDRAQTAAAKGLCIHNDYLTTEWSFKHAPYDVIILADVIEHLVDPASLLKTAASSLSSTGFLIVSVPNIAHWSARLSLVLGKFEYSETGILDATHLRWFTEVTLREYLLRCGLVVKEQRFSSGYGLSAYRRLRKLFGIFYADKLLKRIVAQLARLAPGLFACQFIYRCELI